MSKFLTGLIAFSILSISCAFAQTDDDDKADNTRSNDKGMPSGIHMNESHQLPAARKYKVLGLSPMQFTEIGVGFGLSYEHSIDKNGIVNYILPAVLTFNSSTTYQTDERHQDPMFYLMPGLKFYPKSCYGKIKYAIGPSMVIGAGKQRSDGYYWGTYQTYDKFLFGVMLNNSINFNPTDHIYLGVELGLGFTYLNRLNGVNNGVEGLSQGGLKIGYRF